jgi:hypothetical protein
MTWLNYVIVVESLCGMTHSLMDERSSGSGCPEEAIGKELTY